MSRCRICRRCSRPTARSKRSATDCHCASGKGPCCRNSCGQGLPADIHASRSTNADARRPRWTSGNARPATRRKNHSSDEQGLGRIVVIVATRGQGFQQPGLLLGITYPIQQRLPAVRQIRTPPASLQRLARPSAAAAAATAATAPARHPGSRRQAGRCAPAGRWRCPGYPPGAPH
jgi:hypothetical protein